MTDVNKCQHLHISTIEEALRLYTPPPAGLSGKMGVEVEMALFAAGDPKPVIPDAGQMLQLQSALAAKGHAAQLEAAGVIEYASAPFDCEDAAGLISTIEKDLAAFESVIAAEGWQRSPLCVMPTVTREDAMAARVPRERLETALAAIPHVWGPEALTVPLLTAGVQVSFSPADADAMFRMAQRAYALTPLLMLVMNSSCGFSENKAAPDPHHLRGKAYDAHKTSGGIAESFLQAANGADWMRRHIESVFDAPMLFAYDLDGALLPSRAGHVFTFRQLIESGLNTQSNFELAESFLYHDVKICNLRDAFGKAAGKRLEIRGGDSGLHQPFSMILLTSALIPDGPTATAFTTLLENYGFTGDPREDRDLLLSARAGVVADWRRAWSETAPFGTGTMQHFARDVALLVEKYHYDIKKPLAFRRQAKELLHILRWQESDAEWNVRAAKTLDAATARLCKGKPEYWRDDWPLMH